MHVGSGFDLIFASCRCFGVAPHAGHIVPRSQVNLNPTVIRLFDDLHKTFTSRNNGTFRLLFKTSIIWLAPKKMIFDRYRKS